MITWRPIDDLPKADRELIHDAFRVVSLSPKPATLVSEFAHAPELEAWMKVRLGSPREFFESFDAEAFILSDEGFSYLLPILLSLLLLDETGVHAQNLSYFIDKRKLSVFSQDQKRVLGSLADRLEQIFAGTQEEDVAMYPALAFDQCNCWDEFSSFLLELRNQIG